jgi:hypothetical protein
MKGKQIRLGEPEDRSRKVLWSRGTIKGMANRNWIWDYDNKIYVKFEQKGLEWKD